MRKNTLHQIFRLLAAGPLLFSLTGCPLFGGVSAEDQDLIKSLRTTKKYITPALSANLNDFLKNWHYLAAFNLPSQYGLELANFYSLLPFGGGEVNVTALPQVNPTNKEITLLKDNTNTTVFQFTPVKVVGNSHTYLITLLQSRYGAKGTFQIVTVSANAGKSTTITATTPWRYGNGWYTDTPQSLSVNIAGTLSSSKFGLSANLTQFNQLVPRQGNVSIQLPDLVLQADNLQFTSQGEGILTGTLGIGPSGTGETFSANLQLKNGSIEGTLDNTKRGYNVRLKYDGSALTAEIKSAKDQNKNLAVIDVADGGKQIIKYADGSTEDLSFASVGSTQ